MTDRPAREWSRLIDAPRRHVQAWVLLTAALAIHVADEALTGFLDFYNPLVLDLRARLGWWPMPTFTFGPWLAGLIALVVASALFTPVIRRAGPGTWVITGLFSVVMLFNGMGHLAGSVYFQRWLPGTTSAPLLLVASVLLLRAAWNRQRGRSLASFVPPSVANQVPGAPVTSWKRLADHPRGPIVAISFAGAYPQGSQGNDFAAAMVDYTTRVIAETQPAGVVFDLLDLDYVFGDAIAGVVWPLRQGDLFRPSAAVAHGRTADAIAGLLTSNTVLGLAGVKLVETRHEALAHISGALTASRSEMR